MTPLELAKKNLEDFLKDNPKAQKYQEEINEMLAKVPENSRLDTIQLMLAGRLKELGEMMCCLVAKGPGIR